MLLLVVLALAILNCKQANTQNCFDGCDWQSTPSCLSADRWNCDSNQVCEFRVHHAYGRDPTFECHRHSICHHWDSCDPHDIENRDCFYFDRYASCIDNLHEHPEVQASMQKNQPASVQKNQTCYSAGCDPRDGPNICSAADWACADGDFCRMTIHNASHLSLDCVPAADDEMTCALDYLLDSQACEFKWTHPSLDVHHDCHHCCKDHSCVQNLLGSFPTTTATATTTVTATVATTTTSPTVTTTTTPSTTSMSTTTDPSNEPFLGTQGISSTTTTKPTTTPAVVSCYACSGLQCLMHPSGSACPNGEPYCLTRVDDSGAARQITRSCATQSHCDNITHHQQCLDIESALGSVVCEYCCNRNNCNQPPGLIPIQGLVTDHSA